MTRTELDEQTLLPVCTLLSLTEKYLAEKKIHVKQNQETEPTLLLNNEFYIFEGKDVNSEVFKNGLDHVY